MFVFCQFTWWVDVHVNYNLKLNQDVVSHMLVFKMDEDFR